MRSVLLAGMALAVMLVVHAPCRAQEAKPPQQAEDPLLALKKHALDGYAKLGSVCASKKLNDRARRCFNFVIAYDSDHEAARKGLGYKRKLDKASGKPIWVMDDGLPLVDGVDGDAAKRANTAADAARNEFRASLAIKAKELASAANEQNGRRGEWRIWREFFNFAPWSCDEADAAHAALGHLRKDGEWKRGYLFELSRKAKETLDAATEGGELENADPTAKTLGIKLHCTSSSLLLMKSWHSIQRAKSAHKTADAAMRFSMFILGIDAAPFGLQGGKSATPIQFDYALFDSATEKDNHPMYVKWCDAEARGWDKRSRAQWKSRHGYGEAHPSSDSVANTLAYAVLGNFQNSFGRDCMLMGFAYVVSGNLLGTCATVRYGGTGRDTTKVKGKEIDTSGISSTLSGAEKMRQLAVILAASDESEHKALFSIPRLLNVITSDITVADAAVSMALIEFLHTNYPAEMRKWLATQPTGKREDSFIEQTFGKPLPELHDEWRAWTACCAYIPTEAKSFP